MRAKRQYYQAKGMHEYNAISICCLHLVETLKSHMKRPFKNFKTQCNINMTYC